MVWVSPEEDSETRLLMQTVGLGGDPRTPGETVPRGVRSLVLSIAMRKGWGDRPLQWGDSIFCMMLSRSPHSGKQRKVRWRGKAGARFCSKWRRCVWTSIPVGPGPAETDITGCGFCSGAGDTGNGGHARVSKFLFSLLKQWDELRPGQLLDS